jgi:hypothetical protein
MNFCELLLPLQQPLLGDVASAAAPAFFRHFRWHVGREPVAHFALEGQFLVVEGKTHLVAPLPLSS